MSNHNPRKGSRYQRLRRQVIAEETRCCICGEPVDKNLPPNHPRSATVEHLDPIALGGDVYDRTRCRLAHHGCNSRKGNETRAALHSPRVTVTSRAW
jgi:5-methylcytosine-specific restriction endonuclease McrA